MEFQCSLRHRFIVDEGSIIPTKVFTVTQPSVLIKPTAVRIQSVTDHRLTVLGQSSTPVRLQGKCVFIRFLTSDDRPSILGSKALHELGHSISFHQVLLQSRQQSKD